MAINLNIESDWAIFDNVEAVTLTTQDGNTTTTGLSAVKEMQSVASGEQGGVSIDLIRMTWHLFVGQLGATRPQEHGYITDTNGTKHYIDHGGVSLASWDTRWVVQTTAQAGVQMTKRAS